MGKKNFLLLSRRQQRRRADDYVNTLNKNILFHDLPNLNNEITCQQTTMPEPPAIDIGDLNQQTSSSEQCNDDVCSKIGQIEDTLFTDPLNACVDDPLNKQSLRSELQSWAIKSLLSRPQLNELLRILIRHGHKDLPTDSRSLLKTPRDMNKGLVSVTPGSYYHFGVENSLLSSVSANFNEENIPKIIYLNINVDGLPIAKSSGSQFWPILGQISDLEAYFEPFLIGIYHGLSKPNTNAEYLKCFVDDMQLILETGIVFHNTVISVKIRAIICDAPARAFISGVKNHNGYFGCHKCIQEGDFVEHCMTFPEINSALRTDESFRNRLQEEHHRTSSLIESLGIGMVTQLPLDYLHLVCLGVVKKLLLLWLRGSKDIRLNKIQIERISETLTSFRPHICKEFKRKPRSFNEIDRWKGTEFRQFLLYTGVVALKHNISKDKYIHFLSLHVAIRILASKKHHKELNGYAQSLLRYFVEKFAILYGDRNVSYNVHNLIHISEDVKNLGPLDSFSTFPFENYLQKVKFKTKSSSRPLEQIINRTLEDTCMVREICKRTFPFIIFLDDNDGFEMRKVKSIHINSNMFLSNYSPNNVCTLKSQNVMIINSIVAFRHKILIEGQLYEEYQPLYQQPCNSANIGIKKVCINSSSRHIQISVDEIECKCVKLPISATEYGIIPINHSNEV